MLKVVCNVILFCSGHLAITCSKFTIETLEQWQCQYFTTCSSVSFVNFEHVLLSTEQSPRGKLCFTCMTD